MMKDRRSPTPSTLYHGHSHSPSLMLGTPTKQLATPRWMENKGKYMEVDTVKRLQQICTGADPTRLYRNVVKIRQGASGGMFTAYQVRTIMSVAIKEMDLNQQPKNDFFQREPRHARVAPPDHRELHQLIAAVSRETTQELQHLPKHGVIHRDIKSDNVLLSITSDINLINSEFCADLGSPMRAMCTTVVDMPYWMVPEVHVFFMCGEPLQMLEPLNATCEIGKDN
ncbi:hypothetical protein EVG20_g10075 [Dentipellis fragilis]|uniref:Protein kinase domain-containing protein n=1 Tax=Dentipellis fragilis TaxID=205917 RepID=A0A4Y9XVZ1_9AGAM|nr:hypothetical protein EVG20_g10075 [Dentipellis fragilis]